jgi:hypothetical protein
MVLSQTRVTLEDVRRREPADSRHRQQGSDVTAVAFVASKSSDTAPPPPIISARQSHLSFLEDLGYDSDTDDEWEPGIDTEGGGGATSLHSLKFPPPSSSTTSTAASTDSNIGGGEGGGGGGGGGFQVETPGTIDSWFGGKVDSGPLMLKKSTLHQEKSSSSVAVALQDRGTESLEFMAPEAPSESQGNKVFPSQLALHFQSEQKEEEAEAAEGEGEVILMKEGQQLQEEDGTWEQRSGEEKGVNGYWYRWTEIRGQDTTGAVQWYEKWWEISDWRGMKELGAEKWGFNARGDAWRETWREAISVDDTTGEPMVERTAHKWAKNGRGSEWEEKWGELYLAGGKADKYADKWGREGLDVWHEKWGENYDGKGGCVKYTDKWAEREHVSYGTGEIVAREQWGDKWEERFSDGKGSKKGETWSVSGEGDRFNRYWGEDHGGDGSIRKHGHSTDGEHWDVMEYGDTYYESVPHFGYDLALDHSPQLKGVEMLPREGGGGLGNGGGGSESGGDGGGLSDF